MCWKKGGAGPCLPVVKIAEDQEGLTFLDSSSAASAAAPLLSRPSTCRHCGGSENWTGRRSCRYSSSRSRRLSPSSSISRACVKSPSGDLQADQVSEEDRDRGCDVPSKEALWAWRNSHVFAILGSSMYSSDEVPKDTPPALEYPNSGDRRKKASIRTTRS